MADSFTTPGPGKRPWYHPIALFQRLVIYAVIGYITICVYLFAMQTRMIYVGSTAAISTAAVELAKTEGLIPWNHTTPDASAPQG